MTRVRMDLFVSLDGYTPSGNSADSPMGVGWEQVTRNYTATRTFRAKIFGDTTGEGTTGLDDSYAASFFDGIGAEIMGAAMFGLHSFPDDPDWKGWWGDTPPFGTPVYVLTDSAPRPSIPMEGGTTFHFRKGAIEDVLAEASEAAGGKDVRIGGGDPLWSELSGLTDTHDVKVEVAETGTSHVTFTRRNA